MGVHILRIPLNRREELTVGRDDILLRKGNQAQTVVQRRRVRAKLDRVLTDNPGQFDTTEVEVDAREIGVGICAQGFASQCKPQEDDCLLRRLGVALARGQQLLPLQNRKVDVATRLVFTRSDAVPKDLLRARVIALFELQVALVGLATHELGINRLRPREGIRRCRRIALLRKHQTEVEPGVRVLRIQRHGGAERRLGPLQTALIGLVCIGIKGCLPCGLQGRNTLCLNLFGCLHMLDHNRAGILPPLYLHLLRCAAGRKQKQRDARSNTHHALHHSGLLHG